METMPEIFRCLWQTTGGHGCFIINRFTVDEILGRSVVVRKADDYRTQPAGNTGKRIACGVIKPWNTFRQVH